MKTLFKTFCLGAGLAVAATSASALKLDLTDDTVFAAPPASGTSASYSGTIGSVSWTLTSVGGFLTYSNPPNGFATGQQAHCKSSLGLECDFDGVGVKDDEVSGDTTPVEALRIEFSSDVFVTRLQFLDLYTVGDDPATSDHERAEFTISSASGDVSDTVESQFFQKLGSSFSGSAGWKSKDAGGVRAKSITFFPAPGADDEDFDFALAAIDLRSTDGNEPDVIPLPAGGLLLVGGLGALGLLRRRRKAA